MGRRVAWRATHSLTVAHPQELELHDDAVVIVRAMESGRLFLSDGSAVTCSYEFATSTDGSLDLGAAFIPVGESADATLELATGERRRVTVTFGSRVGEASFVCH